MTDEPFVDETIMFESGIPVRYHNGGHGGAPSVNVPLPGNDGDVLTVVAGAPEWAPPSGGGGSDATVHGWPSPYWLLPSCPFFVPMEVPVPSTPNAPVAGGIARPIPDDDDWLQLASGTGTDTGSVALPSTSDGQTLTTTKAGYSASFMKPCVGQTSGYFWFTTSATASQFKPTEEIYWMLRLTFGSSVSNPTYSVGTSVTANAYIGGETWTWSSNNYLRFPSAINTTSSNANGVRFRATWTNSVAWTVAIARVSFN